MDFDLPYFLGAKIATLGTNLDEMSKIKYIKADEIYKYR
ncbi:hypothetical protein CAXC1_170004 [Candidatus Xenohaliotis californiensis]|uniref:Uncharacterized protein n=1 Tax=Candidatus Xenohaliotis californiensis TaxID=84677 RepID=A0ABM9N7A7_9RICK|nr:hypothetical protein CAXC1_170004 [Candidatus Xenohaliotis californiensis]